MRDHFVRVEVLEGSMQLLNEELLLDDDVFATDLFNRQQNDQVCVNKCLRHLGELV